MSEERCPDCHGHRGMPRILHDQEEPHECTNDFHKSLAPITEFPAPEPAPPQQFEQPIQQTILKPICPYCGTDGKIAGSMTTLGPFQLVVVRCGNEACRKMLGVFQPLGLEMAMPPGQTH